MSIDKCIILGHVLKKVLHIYIITKFDKEAHFLAILNILINLS